MEFRRLIAFGKSSYVISIPKKWVDANKLSKGSILTIAEHGNSLVCSPKQGDGEDAVESVSIDLTELDNSSILHYIQAAYKRGYDEIRLRFTNVETLDFKTNKVIKTMDVISVATDRLIGMEIVQHKENGCVIKDLSAVTTREFDAAFRRVFLILTDMSREISVAARKGKYDALTNAGEQHDSVTKFSAFCIRLLSKKGRHDLTRSNFLYHTLANLDKITDVYKYISKDLVEGNYVLHEETKKIFEESARSVDDFYQLFYKFDKRKIVDMSSNRRNVRQKVMKFEKTLSGKDVHLCSQQVAILDLILDLTESKIAMEI